ncbi:hypothetical protein NKY66_07115 [Sinorhizobium meliloti]|uniref:hypothetical protein n=1 Tax=Rhizobium meliloti TaxID=382 RepID=UPI0039A4B2D0
MTEQQNETMSLFNGVYAEQLERMMSFIRDELRRKPEDVANAPISGDQFMFMTAGMLWADGVPLNMAIWLAGECGPLIRRMVICRANLRLAKGRVMSWRGGYAQCTRASRRTGGCQSRAFSGNC